MEIFMGKIAEWFENFNVKVPLYVRITVIALIIAIIGGAVIGTYIYKNEEQEEAKDTNVYLEEEVCFSGEVFIKVVGMYVDVNNTVDQECDEDGDLLSEYVLNLAIIIEQRNTDFWANNITIKSEMFTLKSVNLKSKEKMSVFFNSLAQATLQTAVSVAIGGEINIIEETMGFAEQYITDSIENAENSDKDFKPIKAEKNQFEEFKPKNIEGPTTVKLSFPIKQEYLESENVIVLTIDLKSKFEKRIFLITRPLADNS